MHTVDDTPETIHLYVVRGEEPRSSSVLLALSVVALLLVVAIGLALPFLQPEPRASIRVPAVLLPPRVFTVRAQVIPTGVHTYPATTAQGTLTITNGSVITQTLPAGVIFITNSGISIATNTAVFVPAGSADAYGFATVTAHALVVGKAGNIPSYAINQVAGSSIYIRNLSAFHGGKDAYSVKFITAQDTHAALDNARQHLSVMSAGLHYPCSETISATMAVAWRCQFVTYRLPPYMRVTGVRLQGKNLIIDVILVVRPGRSWVR
jgi:Baseplate J-like protein